ncbi:transcription factor E2F8 [Scomber scombrus]|uniref:Transcription factor E2F8 n=1 Tax=Scomber scombrus TaxID=13677 RepID=A0AAV1PIQ6_SCOSC
MSRAAFETQNLAQKSNFQDGGFVAPQVPGNTPEKLTGPSVLSAESQQPAMGPLTTPKKGREVGSVDPWTPTSNLKMLISAASPDIRNREKELCMDPDGRDGLDSMQDTENGEECEKMISRKEKSLGLLCHKFLARYPDYPDPSVNNDICLDDVATELNVERRRIYDIMNVLESLHMVSRSAKNRYTWHGRTKLAQTLAILKQVGEEHRYGQQMQQIRHRLLDKEFDFDGGEEKENEEVMVDLESREQGQRELFFVELPGVEFKGASVNSRKDKSLRVMSQKFVMLFLVSNPRVVSLDIAAKILIGEDQVADQDKNKFKTKVRRLYDIANVLRSLKLIEKVHVTEERGRKPAFEWVGPDKFPKVKDLESSTSKSLPKKTSVLESRTSVDNCAKKLFPSSGGKRGFTRHPSLIKLAKSIQDDRRKINSAPSSPVKSSFNDSSNADFPNKMAQLAAICKIELDQESATGDEDPLPAPSEPDAAAERLEPTASNSMEPPQTPVNTTVHLTPQAQLQAQPPPGTVAYIPAQCSPLIPVTLLPQQQGNGSYAVFLHSSSLMPNHRARPQPTSLAVRSMTFEDKTGRSPTAQPTAMSQPASRAPDVSPLVLKRLCPDSASESSPSKTKRTDSNFKDASPKLCEILQARLKARRGGQLSSRPSSRALHLDPEFVNTPGGAAVAHQTLEQSLETFLDREDRMANSDSEAGLTPLREIPLTPGQIHTETLVPAGYLIPISQQSLIGFKEFQSSGGESNKNSTPTYNIFQTPTAGSRPPPAQEITPTSIRLHKPLAAAAATASPHAPPQAHHLHSPSPAILNFTLQNLGLISSPSPVAAFATPQTPERSNTLPSPLSLQQRSMVFIKPLSPVPLQQSGPPQPMALISLQQPLMTTPKGTALPQHSFFHTPVPLSPLAAVVTSGGHPPTTKTVYIPQRRLDVATEES